MSWSDIENALQAAIVSASGFASTKVIWKGQDSNAPPLDYITIDLPGMRTIGIDWKTKSYVGGPAGQDIQILANGFRETTLEVEIFTAAKVGDSAARWIAERIRSSLILPFVRAPLSALGISPFDPMPARNVPQVVGTTFRGRTYLPIRCYVSPQAYLDYGSWIQTINGTITANPGQSGNTPEVDLEYSVFIGPE